MTTDSERSLLPRPFVARTLFIAAALILAAIVVRLAGLWILLFGAVVVAVILRSIADPLDRHTPVKGVFAVVAAVLVILLLFIGMGFLFGREISRQAAELSETLPQAWEVLQERLSADPLGDQLLTQAREVAGEAGRFFALAPKIAGSLAAGLAGLLLMFVAGIFLAAHPAPARDGLLSMLPIEARPRMKHVLDTCGLALKGWLRAQLFSMMLVGVLVAIGLRIIGVPSPLALGLLVGVAQFVPIFGPIAASAPVLLVAAIDGMQTFLLTGALLIAVSQLESNLITPLVQKSVAALPIILTLFAVIAFATLFGLPGALFATPLALVAYTMVTMLYRQDVLHDPNAKAPGEPH